jgi:hypothetical protein
MVTSDVQDVDSDALLRLVARLADAGNYEAVFHGLMAALHVADKDGDMALLERALQIGAAQERAVDAIHPPHRLSTRLAMERRQTPLFRTLQTHGESIRARHRTKVRG